MQTNNFLEETTIKKIPVGIVGAGWVAHHCYTAGLREIGLEVCAVTDINIDAAHTLSKELGMGVVCKNVEEVLQQGAELVIIATPNIWHIPLSRKVLSLGRNVLCEKPLALKRTEAEEVVSIKSSGQLYVSAPYRFRDDVAALIQLVAHGKIGQIYKVQVTWNRTRGVPRPGSWYTNYKLCGGGALTDLGPHLLDIGLLLLGWPKVRSVNAWIGHFLGSYQQASVWMPSAHNDESGVVNVENQASAFFSFEDNYLLELNVGWASYCSGDSTIINVEGTQGRALLKTLFGYSTMAEDACSTLSVWSQGDFSVRLFDGDRQPSVDFGRMLKAIVTKENFRGVEPATGIQALQVVDLIQRAYEAAKRNSIHS